ncbi:acetaldehyde dehydrogenase (acetylating) [Ktedonosporobacter rubrisoli]|uniref:Acetaldehyde dehydrogenase n=1 Tax=Ktedonosporobacter rubrisoli TaxID=2509675 RepID=A0A4P6JPI2_KTERU|nr:acetaldehyde dehydrogenase (acetylating) [Ktedonosporobacter rubrisoli]QBD76676.1 acetaldehyde dehydrogenase (acetylating) [Ktedonosporobacter rubrisoli]
MEVKHPVSSKVKVAIIGSGNIGSDLMYKLLKQPGHMELVLLTGIDPNSDGLARARALGLRTSTEGIQAVIDDPEIKIVFDATSARAHVRHAKALQEAAKIAIDLTPAARGPYVVPPANLEEHLDKRNVNMVTCGGQATVPLVYALSSVMPLLYAEMVSTVASLSAGPGTRQNIDEFTETTARSLEVIGKAKRGKAIIILNPADPPIMMRNTVYAIPEGDFAEDTAIEAVEQMVARVQTYVPGYHLKNRPVVDTLDTPWGRRQVLTMLLEVEGAGDYLPRHAGNLDIMTASARRVGEMFAQRLLGMQQEVEA